MQHDQDGTFSLQLGADCQLYCSLSTDTNSASIYSIYSVPAVIAVTRAILASAIDLWKKDYLSLI